MISHKIITSDHNSICNFQFPPGEWQHMPVSFLLCKVNCEQKEGVGMVNVYYMKFDENFSNVK